MVVMENSSCCWPWQHPGPYIISVLFFFIIVDGTDPNPTPYEIPVGLPPKEVTGEKWLKNKKKGVSSHPEESPTFVYLSGRPGGLVVTLEYY